MLDDRGLRNREHPLTQELVAGMLDWFFLRTQFSSLWSRSPSFGPCLQASCSTSWTVRAPPDRVTVGEPQ
jgi:hypothetical protein